MSRLAMTFPGQGAQSVGMLALMSDRHGLVGETFDEASQVLGYDMARLINEGPAEQLDQTEFTQPALVTASVALWRVWMDRGGATPAALAGHSLGEYSALVAAEAMDFGDALRLTRLRGQAMQDAVGPDEGAMAAVIGLSDDDVRAVCSQTSALLASDGLAVSAANFNAPMQVVIAGHAEAVRQASTLAREKGAKLVKTLAVSVPSHCGLMAPAARRLQSHLLEIPLRQPGIAVYHNVDARPREDVDGIRKALVAQLDQSVLWADSVRAMRQANCSLFVECGPGKVLSGLNKRIDKEIVSKALSSPEEFDQAIDTAASH